MENRDQEIQKLIQLLPDILSEAYKRSQPGWGGSTAEMIRSTYEVTEVLKQIWLDLSKFYPENHFSGKPSDLFINEYIEFRYVWQRALAEPYGAGTGGTIVGINTTFGVMTDMQDVVEQTVLSLLSGDYSPEDHAAWLKRWKDSQKVSP